MKFLYQKGASYGLDSIYSGFFEYFELKYHLDDSKLNRLEKIGDLIFCGNLYCILSHCVSQVHCVRKIAVDVLIFLWHLNKLHVNKSQTSQRYNMCKQKVEKENLAVFTAPLLHCRQKWPFWKSNGMGLKRVICHLRPHFSKTVCLK